MRDYFVGDINDFMKYDLLEKINHYLMKKILIVWMKTTGDGNKLDYLNNLNYKEYNKELFDNLSEIIENNKRTVKQIKNIKSLKRYSSFDEELTNNQRKEYFNKVKKLIKDIDLVFFDPDNGIVPSKNNKRKKEYIYWDEMLEIWKQEKDLLIYQHFPHINHKIFIEKLKKECKENISNSYVYFFESDFVVFILLSHQKNEEAIGKIMEYWNKLVMIGKE